MNGDGFQHHVRCKRLYDPHKHNLLLVLSEDVFTNILIRLPAKQLARMRCVSKPLYAYLSQPCFIKSHLHRNLIRNNNKDNEIILVLNHSLFLTQVAVTAHPSKSPNIQLNDFIKLPLDFPHPKDEWSVIGSVHGLICFKSGFGYQRFDIYIWNPSLSSLMRLPSFNCPSTPDEDRDFDFRFGFDPKSDDYKVVKLMSQFVPGIQVEVYSMRKGIWESISESFPSKRYRIGCENKVIAGHDGHVYWLCLTDHGDSTIVTFDLGNETFYQITLPDSIRSSSRDSYKILGFFQGKLCVTSYIRGGIEFEMWVMNEHHGVTESWVKHYVLSHFTCNNIKPMGFTLNNEFLFRPAGENDRRLALYDPDTTKVKNFEGLKCYYETNIVQYVDSLVWITPPKKQHGKTSCVGFGLNVEKRH